MVVVVNWGWGSVARARTVAVPVVAAMVVTAKLMAFTDVVDKDIN